MRTDPESRRGLPVLALLLALGTTACSASDGMVAGPDAGRSPGSAPAAASGVEGTVFLTHDESSENVAVFMIWTEVEEPGAPGSGIETEKLSVPVAEGELPRTARVAVTRTDAGGHFVHQRDARGGVTLRVSGLPDNCRPPRDRVVELEPDRLAAVQIDVLCYGPKSPPLE
jgi:hypothetical protein